MTSYDTQLYMINGHDGGRLPRPAALLRSRGYVYIYIYIYIVHVYVCI